jgi:acyl carrier protein
LRLCATAFPDLEVVIEDTFGRGDKVVTRWISEGTQTGELPGVPATGRRFRVPGITVDRHEAGRLAESWSAWDILGLFRQLGVAPPMGAVPDALDTAVRETYAVALGIGPEHLGLDSDLEAELGVDSLRHAEIITQLVARIGRDEDAALFEALRQQRTLGRVLDTLRRLTQASSQAPGQDR